MEYDYIHCNDSHNAILCGHYEAELYLLTWKNVHNGKCKTQFTNTKPYI